MLFRLFNTQNLQGFMSEKESNLSVVKLAK